MRISKNGFSLLEVLLVAAIVAVLSSIGAGFYANYGKNVELASVVDAIVFDLKQVQSKAMAGEGGFKWGIRFVNASADQYELFSTPTDYGDGAKATLSTRYLSGGVAFSDPGNGLSKDIIFERISGGTTASSVSMGSGGSTKTISVSEIGTILIQ